MPFKKKLLLLLLCIAFTKCYCQVYTFNKHYSTTDGLISNCIGEIKKDRNGFYWFQSPGGISRFDGKKYVPYPLSDMPTILLDSGIKHYELCFYSQSKPESFIFINNLGKAVKSENTSKLFYTNESDRKLRIYDSYQYLKTRNTKNIVTAIDKITSKSNIFCHAVNQHTSYFTSTDGDVFFTENYVVKNIHKKAAGSYSVLMIRNKLALIDFSNKYYYLFENGKEISNGILPNISLNDKELFISCSQRLSNYNLILVGRRILKASFKQQQLYLENFLTLNDNTQPFSFFFDEFNNTVLVGTQKNGVMQLNANKFTTYTSTNTAINNILYSQAITKNGITTNQDIYDKFLQKTYPIWSWIYTGPICKLNDATFLTTYKKGLAILNNDFKLIKYIEYANFNTSISTANSFVKTDSVVYISNAALIKYAIKQQQLTGFAYEAWPTFGKNLEFIATSPNNNCIYACIGSELQELNMFTQKSTTIAKGFTNEVRNIYYDSITKIIFVSTRNSGCFCVMPNGKIIKLPKGINQSFTTCHYVLQDKQGDYWLPTNNGVYCLFKKDLLAYINKQTPDVTYKFWGKDDGIRNEEFNGGFTGSGILIGDSISLCSMEGRVVFSPNIKYNVQIETGKLIIDAIEINDSSIGTTSTHIKLQPNFKQLTLKVAYPFINKSSGVIEYLLFGTNDTTWHTANENGVINIKNLVAGKYILTVKVGNKPENIKTITINVLPYWYQTWWMYGVYALAVCLLFYLLFRWRLLLASNKQLALLEKTKSQLFTTIAHDLQSPINNFTTLSETMQFLIAEKDFDTIAAIGVDMDKKSKNLTLLLSNILDWSLDEQGIQNNSNTTINLQLLLANILPPYKDIAANKQINVINLIGKQVTITTNEQALSTVLRNLIDNAIKNAVNSSILKICAQQNKHTLYLQVSNTITDTAIPKLKAIQNLLLQAKPIIPLADGIGLGLALIHNNVIKLGGNVKVGITQQVVTFYVELPQLT